MSSSGMKIFFRYPIANENKKYTNILVWVNKKIKNDILPTKCHLTIKYRVENFYFSSQILNSISHLLGKLDGPIINVRLGRKKNFLPIPFQNLVIFFIVSVLIKTSFSRPISELLLLKKWLNSFLFKIKRVINDTRALRSILRIHFYNSLKI